MNEKQKATVDAAYAAPAVYVNNLVIAPVGGFVRMTLLETGAGGHQAVRAAVFMSKEDLAQLRDLANQILELPKPKIIAPGNIKMPEFDPSKLVGAK